NRILLRVRAVQIAWYNQKYIWRVDIMIHIFTTGGTFDKEYNYISGDLTFMDTHIPEMLKRARCGLDVRVEKLMMIDSLEMTDQHRSLIATKCHQSVTDKIVITHGTDTLVETATFLAQ